MSYYTADELAQIGAKPQANIKPSNKGGVRGIIGNIAEATIAPAKYFGGLINLSARDTAATLSGNKKAAKNVQRDRNRIQGTSAGEGLKKLVGNTAGLVTTLLPGGATLKGAVASGATAGAGNALTQKNSTAEDVVSGALTGGVTGGALKGAGTVLSKITKAKGLAQNAADSLDASTSGVARGSTLKGGRMVTPEREQQLLEFKNNGAKKYATNGIKSGTPRSQSSSAQEVYKGVNKQLNAKLDEINRPLGDGDKLTIESSLTDRLKNDLGLDSEANSTIVKNAIRDIKGSKDLKDLETLRKKADDLAFKESGAKGSTERAAQAAHIRDTIDEFITPESPEYKAIKGDYSKAKDLLELTTKGSKTAKGGEIPFTGIKAGTQAIPGVKSKAAGILNKVSGTIPEAVLPESVAPTAGYFARVARQGAAGAVGGSMVPEAEQPQEQPVQSSPIGGQAQAITADDILASEQGTGDDTDPYSPANIAATVKSIIAQGGTQKDVAEFLSNAKVINDLNAKSTGGSLNSTASGVIADTKTGLQALGTLSQKLADSGANNPGIGQLRALNPFDTNAQELQANVATTKQIVGKALEGGVLRKEDEVKYAKLLPTMGDTDAVAQYKIQQLQQLISSRLQEYQNNIAGGSGGTDLAGLGL